MALQWTLAGDTDRVKVKPRRVMPKHAYFLRPLHWALNVSYNGLFSRRRQHAAFQKSVPRRNFLAVDVSMINARKRIRL